MAAFTFEGISVAHMIHANVRSNNVFMLQKLPGAHYCPLPLPSIFIDLDFLVLFDRLFWAVKD
jgi:hypothetical protein